MSLKTRLMTAAALGAAAFAAPAAAQEAERDAAVAVAVTDVITVTAQKREQSLAEVPIALTALGEEQLEALGIGQFDELSDFVPGLEIQEQSPNNPGFVIRGITSDSGGATDEARVAVFQDGVPITKSRGSYVELFDMERIEVAKGPQPTLFGRGALIGGINLIQNKPDLDAFAAEAWAGIGTYDRTEFGAMVNMPVSDTLALRFAMIDKAREGYVENALGGEDFNSVDLSAYRLSARFEPTAEFSLDIIANYQEDTPSGTSFKSGTIAPVPGGSLDPWEPAALNTFGGFEGGRDLGLEREVYGISVLADYAFSDALTLTSITGWRGFESLEIFDPDGFAAELLVVGEDAVGQQWSQELRLNFDNGGRVTGFVGGSVFIEDAKQRIPLATNEAVAQAFLAPVIAGGAGFTVAQIEGLLAMMSVPNAGGFDDPFNPLTISVPAFFGGQIVALRDFYLEETANFGETTAYDLFGDVTVAVSDRLDLTAGLRWTKEEKEASVYGWNAFGANRITFAPPLFLPATPNGTLLTSGTREFDDFTWRLAANYDVSEQVNLWASYARGRRPDVISFDTSEPDPFVTVPAEIVDSYEVGGFWTLDSTTLQASAFYSEYENFQTSRFEPNQATFITDNAGLATQYGVEAQLNHAFTDTVSLFASYAWNHAEFDETDDQGNVQEFAGNAFRLSPEHAFALGLQAEFDLAAGGTLAFLPTFSWQSEVFFDNDNDLTDAVQDEVQGDYGIVDFKVRYETGEGGIWAEAYVENLLDEDYIIDAGNTGDSFGIPTFIAGAPRMSGIRIGGRF
ncbi:TonB-dependent receptor [Marinicauda algicola]|uniref:TonB-dependent receptor n=1 Tax=Marinicauda algicola TaxID=2029849 RepID=A0A4S2H4D5_9PROT|nr:TonB-dependent receptor [Marinicauda algicola]TGY90507.1 TonB-dependent receptor [Marinicauda algicola]